MADLMRVLVVDDEEGIRFFLSKTLQRDGHIVSVACSGEEALEKIRDDAYDLVLLDLMLGGQVDGQRVLEFVKWRWPDTMVIILTAHGSLESAIDAIDEGVDGYLLKPVKPNDVRDAIQTASVRRERLARHQAIESTDHVLQKGPFQVDLDRRAVMLQGDDVTLTPSEFKLLVYMIQNAQQVISPKDLVRVVRQYEPEHLYEARQLIKWYIHRLRQKLEPDPANPVYLVNVRGAGYMLEV